MNEFSTKSSKIEVTFSIEKDSLQD